MISKANDLYNRGVELIEQENYGEALQLYIFANLPVYSLNEAIVFDEKDEYVWFDKGYCENELK